MVGAHREDQPAGDGVPVDGRDHRPRELVPAGEQCIDRAGQVGLLVGRQVGDDPQISPGGEELPSAGDHDGSGRVGHELLEQVDARGEERRVERVRGWTVDRDDGDLAVLR